MDNSHHYYKAWYRNRMLKNGNGGENPLGIADTEKNYYLRDGDIVYLPEKIASILIQRGKAEIVK